MTTKLFRFRGGVHPEGRKEHTAHRPIGRVPLPERLFVPLLQHIGTPAEPVVKVGQPVLRGELVGRSAGPVSAPVHAPTSGRIKAIGDFTAPHPSGLPVLTITLETDGEDRWIDIEAPPDPFSLEPEEIAARVGAAGIVGMGGAAFPSAVKLRLGQKNPIHTLIINGGECEPYLTCDDRLMRERPDAIVDGVRIMLRGLGTPRAIVAIEDNKPEAAAAVQRACTPFPEVNVAVVPSRYPMGSEKQMIQAVTGREVPAGGLSSDVSVLVHNVGTAHAVHEALRSGRPLVSRIITVAGGAVAEPNNVEAPIGTLIADLVAHCGGFTEDPARLVMGGPMMGQVLPHPRVPVVKGSSGILALSGREVRDSQPGPCIRCARCVAACPVGLMPLEMAARTRSGDLKGAVSYGLVDCIACGSCSYVCPAGIPLVHYFNYAKGELAARQRAEHKSHETRKLAEARSARAARIKQEKAEAAARRRAEREAQRAQESTETEVSA